MVLFKRKPVRFLQPPHVEDEDQDVWHIPQTGEVFVNYEEYLHRMDFYNQPRFICEITGHSGQTFFDALKSELAGAQEVDQAFPEALKGPVLRRVQFQTISRIDALVDTIYDEFKSDYYPGEAVTIELASGERCTGIVRDKSRMGSKVLPDGTITQPYSRYFTSIDGKPGEEAVVDDEHIFRERKVFTKSVLRSFIKKTVTREAWTGAPWLVKHDVAAKYHIDTRVPPHLRYDNKLLERKQHLLQKKALQPTNGNLNGVHDLNGLGGPFHNFGPARLPELKPAPKSHKAGKSQGHYQAPVGPHVIGGPSLLNDDDQSPLPQMPGTNPFHFPGSFRQNMPPPPPVPVYRQPTPPPPPPLPKYPIEDLQLEPRDDYVRPALKFLCSDPPEGVVDCGERNDKILMKSMGPLLETWDTLNVYCEIFKLDSFTFDDFVQGLEIAKPDMPCQLFDEIHCAVLKQLVTSEKDGGELQVDLPELDDEEEDEEDEDEGKSAEPTPEPEPEPKPAARATRSSLAKQEAERLQAEIAAAAEKEKTPEPTIKHRAADVLAEFDWVEQLSKRNFQDGGWEMIMVGLLYQLSKDERRTETCERLLEHLVPMDVKPTKETVRDQYGTMDLNDRVSALQIICMLTTGTKAMRNYMEECAETMTGYRKERIEWQRNKKQAMEELKVLNEEHKALLPDNLPPSPPAEEEEPKTNGDVSMAEADTTLDEPSEEGDSDDGSRRKRRRGGDRAVERQRKREELQRKKEAELAAKVPKQSKQFLKVLKDIQKKEEFIKKCEEEVATLENDLREADCGRTRVLGKDRFWNRYYWFERNGMPYGGLPNSSTAHAGYASGCIWVQGPDDMEREGYIDMQPEFQAEYKAKFNMTVPQRKKMEEGRTSVFNARQWGYFSEPEEVDSLLNWLDPRGYNELKLRKEILAFKDKIVEGMKSRYEYLGIEKKREAEAAAAAAAAAEAEAAAKKAQEEEEEKKKAAEAAAKQEEEEEEVTSRRPSRRMATRGKNQQQQPTSSAPPAAAKPEKEEPETFRCLEWENTMAIDEIGHIHSEPPPPPAVKGKKGARKSKS